MNIILQSEWNVYSDFLLLCFLVFLRISSGIFFLPGFGESMIPVRVRLALSIGLTTLIVPTLMFDEQVKIASDSIILLCAFEILAGLIFGLALRLVYLSLQIAGVVAAQVTSLSQLLGAGAIEPQPALGAIMMMAGLALAMSLGFGIKIAFAFTELFQTLPPGSSKTVLPDAEWFASAVAASFRLAVVLAAPFLIVSLVYNLGLGVINKAMPQLMVAFVGAPAITLGTIALLVLVSPTLLSVWQAALADGTMSPFSVTK